MALVTDTFEWMFKVTDKVSGPMRSIKDSFAKFDSALDGSISIFNSAIKATSELIDLYLGLGINVKRGTKEFEAASKAMSHLEFGVGLSTDEAKSLANLGQQLGFVGKQYTEFTTYTGEYAKASGQSVETIAEMNYALQKMGHMSTRQMRNLGDSMIYVAQTTGISHDQLTSFTKGLTKVYARIPDMSEETAGRVTADLQAVAGAFARNLGDPSMITDWMEKMLDPMSKEGWRIKGRIAQFTGMTVEEIMEGIKTDPGEVLAKLSEGFAGIPESQLQAIFPQLQEVFGMSFEQLRGMQKMAFDASKGGMSIRELMEKNRKQMEKENVAKERAARLTNWYSKQQEGFRRSILRMWSTIGKPLMAFLQGFLKPFIKAINELATDLSGKTGGDITNGFKEFGTTVGTFVADKLKAFSGWVDDNWDGIKSAFKTGGKIITGVFDVLTKIANVIPWKFIADNIGTIATGLMAWKIAKPFMGGLMQMGGMLGKFGKMVPAVGALFAGWSIGRALAEVTGLDDKISNLLTRIAGIDDVTKVTASSLEQVAYDYAKGVKGSTKSGNRQKTLSEQLSGMQGMPAGLQQAASMLEAQYLKGGKTASGQSAIEGFYKALGSLTDATSGDVEETALAMLLNYEKQLKSATGKGGESLFKTREFIGATKIFGTRGIEEKAGSLAQAKLTNEGLRMNAEAIQSQTKVMESIEKNTRNRATDNSDGLVQAAVGVK